MAIQIIDNQNEEQSVKAFLEKTLPATSSLDIATGYFEVGSLLLLDGKWQKLEKIRILFGDEVTARTNKVFEQMLKELSRRIDNGIEEDKEKDEFLTGVPSVIAALKSGKIECRVCNHSKFHAKSYILYFNESTSTGRALSGEDILHYSRIIAVLKATEQIMHEIDAVFSV